MKKLILTSVCALALTGAAFAQGTIQWVGGSTSLIVQTNSTVYSPLFGGGSAAGSGVASSIGNMQTVANIGANAYYFTLLTQPQVGGSGSQTQSPVPSTLNALFSGWAPAWSDPLVYATNGTVAGRPIQTPGGDVAQSVNWANLTTNAIMLVGWSGNLGSTWAAVSNNLANWATDQFVGAFFGLSATGYINPGVGNPGNSIFGSSAVANVGLPIFNPVASAMPLYLLPAPEPTTMALAGLGGLSLLLFRRRK